MGSKHGSHMVDLLFTLALFCVFAASALMVVLVGANVYKNTVSQSDENFAARTSVTYVVTKLRQADSEGNIAVGELDGAPALVLGQTVDGDVYQTWIYHHDGALREQFVAAGTPVSAGSGGQVIVEIPAFSIERQGAGVVLTSTDADGNTTRQIVTPRCGVSEAVPGEGVAL